MQFLFIFECKSVEIIVISILTFVIFCKLNLLAKDQKILIKINTKYINDPNDKSITIIK